MFPWGVRILGDIESLRPQLLASLDIMSVFLAGFEGHPLISRPQIFIDDLTTNTSEIVLKLTKPLFLGGCGVGWGEVAEGS